MRLLKIFVAFTMAITMTNAFISLARNRHQSRHAAEAFEIVVTDEYGATRSVKGCKSDFNILVNLKSKGVDAPSSCTNGTCNVCAALVLAGMENIVAEVEASAFEEELRDKGLILTCVNKCVGPGVKLVLGKADYV
jgi:ferredoxin